MNVSKLEEIKLNYSNEPFSLLKRAIVTYDKELAKKALDGIISNKIDPIKALDSISETLSLVGDAFANDELFLPDLVAAGNTMESIMPILEEEIKKAGKEKKSLGKVIIGTVLGDVHTIGKTMVATLLKAGGFEVIDLGVDVSAVKFIEAVKKYNPDILAMSALLTTTAYEQKNVIENLKKENLRTKVKIMVGGGAVTEDFANSIGADGFESTAPAAVGLAKRLIGKN